MTTVDRPKERVVAAAGNWRYCLDKQPGEGGTYLVRISHADRAEYGISDWNGKWWSREKVSHWAPLYTPMGELVCP